MTMDVFEFNGFRCVSLPLTDMTQVYAIIHIDSDHLVHRIYEQHEQQATLVSAQSFLLRWWEDTTKVHDRVKHLIRMNYSPCNSCVYYFKQRNSGTTTELCSGGMTLWPDSCSGYEEGKPNIQDSYVNPNIQVRTQPRGISFDQFESEIRDNALRHNEWHAWRVSDMLWLGQMIHEQISSTARTLFIYRPSHGELVVEHFDGQRDLRWTAQGYQDCLILMQALRNNVLMIRYEDWAKNQWVGKTYLSTAFVVKEHIELALDALGLSYDDMQYGDDFGGYGATVKINGHECYITYFTDFNIWEVQVADKPWIFRNFDISIIMNLVSYVIESEFPVVECPDYFRELPILFPGTTFTFEDVTGDGRVYATCG